MYSYDPWDSDHRAAFHFLISVDVVEHLLDYPLLVRGTITTGQVASRAD
jgi:hypothetical protein